MKINFISQLMVTVQLWIEVSSRALIIGGKEPKADKFPCASLIYDYSPGRICGGSLIACDVILSAV